MNKYLLIAPFVALTACEAPIARPSTPPVPSAAADTCDGAQYANLIGQDATALERVMILGQVRIIRPGQAVTMDFRPERINFNIDANNNITSITCQ